MRSKEHAHDYRYFSDPDLMVLEVPRRWVERIFEALPELPRSRRQRFEREYALTPYDAEVLTQTVYRADYFESAASAADDAKLAANWITGELLAALNKDGVELDAESPVTPEALGEMLRLLIGGVISGKMAKQCFSAMYAQGVSPSAWVEQHGGQITDEGAIELEIRRVLDANPGQVSAYRAGKVKLLGFFVGQVMKATRGKANPQSVNAIARRLLDT